MKKICFYCDVEKPLTFSQVATASASGTLSSMLNVAFGLAGKEYYVEVLGSYETVIVEDGIVYRGSRDILSIRDHSREFDIFVFVGHCGNDISERVKAGNVLYWAHNWIEPAKYSALLKNRSIDGIVFVSHYHRAQYILKSIKNRVFNFSDFLKLHVIHNAINTELMESYVKDDLSEKKQKGIIELAFVGFPSLNKGFDRVCHLVEMLNAHTDKKVYLHVYGGEDLYSKLGVDGLYDGMELITEYVRLHGSLGREELYSELILHDAVISGLNASETFCLSLLEACYIGIPVVSCKAGGQIEFLKHKKNAYLHGYGEGYSKKVCDEIIEFIIGCRQSKSDRETYRKNFSIPNVSSQWKSLLSTTKQGFQLGSLVLTVRSFFYLCVAIKR